MDRRNLTHSSGSSGSGDESKHRYDELGSVFESATTRKKADKISKADGEDSPPNSPVLKSRSEIRRRPLGDKTSSGSGDEATKSKHRYDEFGAIAGKATEKGKEKPPAENPPSLAPSSALVSVQPPPPPPPPQQQNPAPPSHRVIVENYRYDEFMPVAEGPLASGKLLPPPAATAVAPSTTVPTATTTTRAPVTVEQVSATLDPVLSNRSVIKYSDLKLGQSLGEGNFGQVFMAKLWGIVVAVKVLRATGAASQADMARELAVLKSLRHPNTVMLLGHAVRPDDGATLMIMEYMERGSLHGLIHDAKAQICEDDVLSIAVQLSQGLRYLHEQEPPMFHRDLTSYNVLVDRDGTCKLSDFGLTAVRGEGRADSSSSRRFLTNRRWRAPEATADHFAAESDIYSFAMVLYELFSRMEPFGPDVTLEEVTQLAASGKRPVLPPETPRHWAQLIEASWHQDPSKRPSAKVLMRTFRNFASLEDWLGPQLSGSAAPVNLPGTHVRLCVMLAAVFQPGKLESALGMLTERVTARLSQAPEAWYALLCMPKLCKVLLFMVFPSRRVMTGVNQMLADDFNGPTWPVIGDLTSSHPVFSTAEAFFHGTMQPRASYAAVVTTTLRFDEGVDACVETLRKTTEPSLSACSSWRGTLFLAQHNAGKLTTLHFFNRDPVSAMATRTSGETPGIFDSTISPVTQILTSTPTIELFNVRSTQWVVAPEDAAAAAAATSRSYWSYCNIC